VTKVRTRASRSRTFRLLNPVMRFLLRPPTGWRHDVNRELVLGDQPLRNELGWFVFDW
jgi:hypothetical protein